MYRHISRKSFLLYAGFALGALMTGKNTFAGTVKSVNSLKTERPKKALVAWYSQTGHTEGYAGLIGRTLTKNGLIVDYHQLHSGKVPDVSSYDLIIIGTPVHYLDVPGNVKNWLDNLPPINGAGVAAFATYGGKGDGQYNAAVTMLAALTEKGGVPLGMDTFGNMSAYPPTWSMGNSARTLRFRHKPDKATYDQVRSFADAVLNQYGQGRGIEVKSKFGFMDLFKGGPSIWVTKRTLGSHTIDRNACLNCGACVKACPVQAVNIEKFRIDNERCIICFGCLNKCPAGAHKWTTFGKTIYSFAELLRQNNVSIMPPPAI